MYLKVGYFAPVLLLISAPQVYLCGNFVRCHPGIAIGNEDVLNFLVKGNFAH